MAEKLDGIALGSIAVGVALAYAGIKGKSIPSLIQGFVQGKSPAAAAPGNQIVGTPQKGTTAPAITPNNAGAAPPPGTPPADLTGTESANRALGRLMAASYGWGTGQNWQALDYGWGTLESGWRTTAAYDSADPYNHAYGIPQANPGTKMASAGANWKTSAATQIKWGLQYIKDTYGSPSQVPGWLGQGGYVGY